MVLAEELGRIAGAAAAHGEVSGVLAAEPTAGQRLYLVAFDHADSPSWLVFDDAGRPLDRREEVRAAASIVAICELAAEVAGGGDLHDLRQRLAQLRVVEQPPGIEEAEQAAVALERALGAPPRLASPGYLDAVGIATVELERALGQLESPFSAALRAGSGAVDEFVRDVERRYKLELR
jgi:hypothetical protein